MALFYIYLTSRPGSIGDDEASRKALGETIDSMRLTSKRPIENYEAEGKKKRKNTGEHDPEKEKEKERKKEAGLNCMPH